MARSQQQHTARELAPRLGMSFAYGVEFLELGLDGERERSAFAGQRNVVGYQGNAILARRLVGDTGGRAKVACPQHK